MVKVLEGFGVHEKHGVDEASFPYEHKSHAPSIIETIFTNRGLCCYTSAQRGYYFSILVCASTKKATTSAAPHKASPLGQSLSRRRVANAADRNEAMKQRSQIS
ncbi:hypothetical protein MN608_08461 [Microdochium nivale]|nr:hypothetical protein MN608_08461 [Microdochium nivale]